jgi:hypothetical protein
MYMYARMAVTTTAATTSPPISHDSFTGKCLSPSPLDGGGNQKPHKVGYILKFTRDVRGVKSDREKMIRNNFSLHRCEIPNDLPTGETLLVKERPRA